MNFAEDGTDKLKLNIYLVQTYSCELHHFRCVFFKLALNLRDTD